MLPPLNWAAVIAAAVAGFAVSMIFYSLPIMQKRRREQAVKNASHTGPGSETFVSAILPRLTNTFLYAYAFAWILSLTRVSPLIMGIILVLVGMLRAAFTLDGWNRDMVNEPPNVRFVDNTRFILMYVVMTGILLFWE